MMTKVIVLRAMCCPKLKMYACGIHPIPYTLNMNGIITAKKKRRKVYYRYTDFLRKNQKEIDVLISVLFYLEFFFL